MDTYTFNRSVRAIIFVISWLAFISGCKENTVQTIVIGADDVTNPAIQPRIVFTSPGNDAVGPFELYSPGENSSAPHLLLRFNKLMSQRSVDTKLIRIEGFQRPIKVYVHTGNNYYPLRTKPPKVAPTLNSEFDDILAFTISDSITSRTLPYPVGKSITVTVMPGLVDINGNKTSEIYRFNSLPEPYFRVTEIYPEEESSPVTNTPFIAAIFNSEVDDNVLNSLNFSPAVDGVWKVSGYDSTYVFFKPLDYLAFNTPYTISVATTAMDHYGNSLHEGRSSRFITAPFQVSSVSPRDGSQAVELGTSISLALTGPVDTSSVRASISITPPTAIYNYPLYSSEWIFLNPVDGLVPNTVYTVNVSTTLRAAGGTPLQSPYSFSFTTGSFHVSGTIPADGDFGVSRSLWIQVYCNAKIDTGSVRSAFGILPPVAGNFSFNSENGAFSYIPASPIQSSTVYTVTISTSLRTKNGYSPTAPFTFKFKTQM